MLTNRDAGPLPEAGALAAGPLRALRSRNYRLFFTGQAFSLVGTWMQRVAMSWLVYRLTSSPFALGVVDFASQIATLLLGFFAGALVDRVDLRRLLVWTQALAMGQALLLSALTLTGKVSFLSVLACGAFLGMINAFDMPARHAFVIRMVDRKEDLGNAIALNSSLFNLARLLGPSLAGIVIAAVGEGLCFLLNGLSYFSIIVALKAMRLNPAPEQRHTAPALAGIRQGLAYAWENRSIRDILTLLCCLSLLGLPYVVMMPVFAREVLRGGPRTLGFLMGATGIGALAGSMLLAARKGTKGLEKGIPVAAGLFSAAVIGFAFSPVPAASYILVAMAGFGMISTLAACNTMLQTLVDNAYRGRIMSLYTMSLVGIAPFGSLCAGWLTDRIGVRLALAIGGACCMGASLWFRKRVHAFRKPLPSEGESPV
jgi:MFS family permease